MGKYIRSRFFYDYLYAFEVHAPYCQYEAAFASFTSLLVHCDVQCTEHPMIQTIMSPNPPRESRHAQYCLLVRNTIECSVTIVGCRHY